MSSDKRQYGRIPVSLKVNYPSKGDLRKDMVTDLSPGGLFIRTSKPLAIGTEVDLEVSIAVDDPPITVRGKVVWLRGQGGKEGMGIKFTGIMGQVLLEMVEAAKKG